MRVFIETFNFWLKRIGFNLLAEDRAIDFLPEVYLSISRMLLNNSYFSSYWHRDVIFRMPLFLFH